MSSSVVDRPVPVAALGGNSHTYVPDLVRVYRCISSLFCRLTVLRVGCVWLATDREQAHLTGGPRYVGRAAFESW